MGKTKNGESGAARSPSAEGLAQAAAEAARAGPKRGLPPVHLWNPPHCGEIDMRIARDGTWFYLGTPIGRPAMVRLFSTILRKDPEGYVLVTPVEKVAIRVDDAPFVAVDLDAEGGALRFTTNVGDEVEAGPDHPIRVERDPATGEPSPYLHVRADLWALIDRKTFYRLVELGEVRGHEGADWFGVESNGAFFLVVPAAELPE